MKPHAPHDVELFPLDLDPAGVCSEQCGECRGWRSEDVVVDGRAVVREWHRRECPWFLGWSDPLWGDGELWDAITEPTGDRAVAEIARGLPSLDGLAIRSVDSLGEVMSRIDEGDPRAADGDGDDVSVWEDPDRLAAQIWRVLELPMALTHCRRWVRPPRSDALAPVLSIGRSATAGDPPSGGSTLEAHSSIDASVGPPLRALRELGVRSWASVPLVLREVHVGSFAVGSAARSAFSDHEVLVLRVLADCLADAVEAAERDRGPRSAG